MAASTTFVSNPVVEALGRRLRLAVIGGGPGSFIGETHRAAARMDDRYELVAGALTSDPERSVQAGRALGLDDDRSYGDGRALLAAESERADGADVVAVMTPNDSHHAFASEALDLGFDVVLDKPLTNTMEEATDLLDRVRRSGRLLCLTHNYTGYPMVRQARAMVEDGLLGTIRLVQVEYVQGGKAGGGDPDPENPPWRFDPVRGGPSLVLGDIGTHAHNLVRFVTGLEVEAVAAEVGTIVPDRRVHDYAGAMLRLDGGARGSFWVTQAAAGVVNALRIRVSGSLGSVEWHQERPTELLVTPLTGPARTLTAAGPDLLPLAARSSRLKAGHPEGFPEAFANLYSDFAEAVAARLSGQDPDPLALHFPTVEDGVRGVRFVEAALASNAADGAWTSAALPG